MGTYFVLMTSIFVNVYIISAIGDRLKEEVHYTICLYTRQLIIYQIFCNTYPQLQTNENFI